jgi:hypothetical protein
MSYPSGHLTESMALILADMFPDKRAALDGITWKLRDIIPRIICAGCVLAQAIVREMQ